MAELRPPNSPVVPQAPRAAAPAAPAPVAPRPTVVPHVPQPIGPAKISPVPTQTVKPVELEPLSLVDEPAAAGGPSKIKAFSSSGPHGTGTHTWKRQLNTTGHGAVRVRTFHGRLSDEGMDFLDNKINEWLDAHAEIEIKFVTTNIGTFEGKIREPALIVNVWY